MTTPIRDTYTAEQWHEIVPGELWTQITHNTGSSLVVFTEAPSLPAPYSAAVPAYKPIKQGDDIYFNSVTPGNNIYFWPLNGDVSMTITVAEV